MATWKCEVKMKFGKYSSHVWKATERPGNSLADNLDEKKDAVGTCIDAIQKAGFTDGDEVIFRDSAYASLAELRHVMSRAPY
ncbi:MAG: hypothetical protein KC502_23370 [Myxococcales bacterium]|nr:hypothetical protein [Myxococcales bacterium]